MSSNATDAEVEMIPPVWTKELEHYTGYTVDELSYCVRKMWANHNAAPSKRLSAVYTKYSKEDHCSVSSMFRACSENDLPPVGDTAIKIGGR